MASALGELWSRDAADDGRPTSSAGKTSVRIAKLHVTSRQVNLMTCAGHRVNPVWAGTAAENKEKSVRVNTKKLPSMAAIV